MQYSAIPPNRRGDVTYSRIVVSYCPQKEEPHCTRLTIGGNLIQYDGDLSTPTAEISTAKLLFNSVVSTAGAKFATADIGNFYLGTPMEVYEYMFYPSTSFRTKSHNNTTYKNLQQTAKHIAKSEKACTAYPRPAS